MCVSVSMIVPAIAWVEMEQIPVSKIVSEKGNLNKEIFGNAWDKFARSQEIMTYLIDFHKHFKLY